MSDNNDWNAFRPAPAPAPDFQIRPVDERLDGIAPVKSDNDRRIHFVVYLVAGAAMGGFLDVSAFNQPTPVTGMILGAGIAVLFQGVIWYGQRRGDE